MFFRLRHPALGEILVAWQSYKANSDDEISLQEGDVVELLDVNDQSSSSSKRVKIDPELDGLKTDGKLLDNAAARHKLSVKPRRHYASSRHSSSTRLNINARWLVREVAGNKQQGWVPCRILQTADDPALDQSGLPGDAAFRRQAVVKELVETEQEFVRDLDYVVQNYLIPTESGQTPKIIKNNFDVLFGNLKEIAEFHRTVLMDGVKYYANEPILLGKAFLRLERDFDNHVNYCKDEHRAQEFLDSSDEAYNYFAELSQRLGDDKSISEHLKLPIQRINDYQLLLKELVRYSACLGENNADLQKALELMLSVPHRSQDDKFTSSIEGYKGSIHKLGRLLAHDRFCVSFGEVTKERYLFLFKARILICKIRRISEDRSIFQLKDIIRLPQVEIKDHPESEHIFELVDKVGGQCLTLKAYRDRIKNIWLKEIREFAKDYDGGEIEENNSDEFQIASPPTEGASSSSKKSFSPDKESLKTLEPPKKLPKLIAGVQKSPQQDLLVSELKSAVKKKQIICATEEISKSTTEQQTLNEKKGAFTLGTITTTSTTTDLIQSDTLKHILTPESEAAEPTDYHLKRIEAVEPLIHIHDDSRRGRSTSSSSDRTLIPEASSETSKLDDTISVLEEDEEAGHLRKIKALEPLIQVNKPRVPEQKVEYHPKPPPEKVPGSALTKLYSIESQGISRENKTVLTDFKVGIEFNVEVDADEMSKRYTSSTAGKEGGSGYESSYNRRTAQHQSYTSDGHGLSPSSRYSTESSSAKFTSSDPLLLSGSKYESLSSSKYDSLPSKYEISSSKYDPSSAITTSKYGKSDLASSLTSSSSYTTRKPLTEANDDDDFTSSYKRRSLKASSATLEDDPADSAYSYSRKIRSSGLSEDVNDYSSPYTKKYSSSKTVTEGDPTDSYYTKRSVRGTLEAEGDNDNYSIRKSIRSSLEGSSALDPHNTDDIIGGYSTKRSLGSELGSKYSRRSVSAEGSDSGSRYSIRSVSREENSEETEKLINKYINKKNIGEEEEDKYAKFERKYSRTEPSSTEQNISDDTPKYSRRISRKDSVDVKIPEDDPYERYARKYLRNQEETSETMMSSSANKRNIDEQDEEYSSSVAKKYLRSKTPELEESSIQSASTKAEKSEHLFESKEQKMDSSSSSSFRKESKSEIQKIESATSQAKSRTSSESLETTMKTSREKSAEQKLGEIDGNRPHFIKTIRGTSIELTTDEREERAKSDHPEFLVSMKDAELLENTYLRFMVKVVGEPNPEISFFKDGKKITETDKRMQIIREHSDKGFYELVIPEVKKTDAGIYKCVATNKFGEASSDATVTVTDNKEIFEPMPEGELLPAGEKPDFHWKKDGTAFEPDERFKVLMGDDEDSLALVFQHVKPDDVGLYTCVAQTSRGHISCSAELTVHGTVNQLFREPEKPTLVIEKREPIVTAGNQAMLELQIKGYPKPQVKFEHEGKTIEPGTKYKLE